MKKKDMTTLIEKFRRISKDFSDLADELEGKGTKEQTEISEVTEEQVTAEASHENETPVTEATPTAEATTEMPQYSFEQVRGILAEKSRSGHREQVKALIVQHGGEQLSDYKEKPEILAALVKEAEGL